MDGKLLMAVSSHPVSQVHNQKLAIIVPIVNGSRKLSLGFFSLHLKFLSLKPWRLFDSPFLVFEELDINSIFSTGFFPISFSGKQSTTNR
jgi:hypothetical protein